jgi:hypothetical protein
MTNDETRMTKETRSPNDERQSGHDLPQQASLDEGSRWRRVPPIRNEKSRHPDRGARDSGLASRGAPFRLSMTVRGRDRGMPALALVYPETGRIVEILRPFRGHPGKTGRPTTYSELSRWRFKKIFERSTERRVHSLAGTLAKPRGPMAPRELRCPRMIRRFSTDCSLCAQAALPLIRSGR